MKSLVWILVLLGCATAASQSAMPSGEQDQSKTSPPRPSGSTDSLIIGGEWQHYVAAANGGGGSLDWLRTNENGRTYSAGVAQFSIAGSRWAFARGSVAMRPHDRIILQTQASAGGGTTGATGFGYQIYGGSVTCKALKQLYFKLGDQYLLVGQTRGNLIKPGVTLVPGRRMSADMTYTQSTGGNLGTGFISGRLDFSLRPASLVGGFAAGHTTPEVFNVRVGGGPAQESLREGFAGVSVPLSRSVLTVVVDLLNLEATHKRTLTLSWKVPLRRP